MGISSFLRQGEDACMMQYFQIYPSNPSAAHQLHNHGGTMPGGGQSHVQTSKLGSMLIHSS